MCDFNEVLQFCSTQAASANDRRPNAVNNFENYMAGFRDAKKLHKFHSVSIQKFQIGQQQVGELVQENFHYQDLEHKT